MKLRYLSLKNYGPLKDVDVVFSAFSPLNSTCSIRFVVGVNGSGKTHLLKALSEIFIALADWQPPHFPVTLIYELGGERWTQQLRDRTTTVILDSPGTKSQASLWVSHKNFQFQSDADKPEFDAVIADLRKNPDNNKYRFRPIIRRKEWTGKETTPETAYLPKTVLIYTTGALGSWEQLWRGHVDSAGVNIVSQDLEYDWSDERPARWSYQDELKAVFDSKEDPESDVNELGKLGNGSAEDRQIGTWQPLLLDSCKLKCALLAVALPQTLDDLPRISNERTAKIFLKELNVNGDSLPGLRGLLARGGWAWPVSVSIKQDSKNDEFLSRQEQRLKLDWLSSATQVIPEPNSGTTRTLWFDIGAKNIQVKASGHDGKDDDAFPSGGAALLKLIGGKETSAFERFERLLDLLNREVILDLNIVLRKIDHEDLLTFDELSDGEQMVLCRMALFHLLNGQKDVLLLLDEPETHFNDKWKRDVVDIIDEAIGNTTNEVVIATHAALVLTDALRDEITLMKPVSGKGSRVFPLGDDVHTFGATSDHPLRDVFGARDTVGRRASKLLEVLLASATHSTAVEAFWAGELTGPDKDDLIESVLTTASVTEQGLNKEIVINCLDIAVRFAEHAEVQKPLRMINVLETFIDQTGPGYFRIELMRAWRRIKEGAPNVA